MYLDSEPSKNRSIPIHPPDYSGAYISGQPVSRISVVSEGTVFAGSVVVASDQRIKTDIVPIVPEDAADIVANLTPSTYRLVSETTDSVPGPLKYGFVAQNVAEVIPEATTTTSHWVPLSDQSPRPIRWVDAADRNRSCCAVDDTTAAVIRAALLVKTPIGIRVRSGLGVECTVQCDGVDTVDTDDTGDGSNTLQFSTRLMNDAIQYHDPTGAPVATIMTYDEAGTFLDVTTADTVRYVVDANGDIFGVPYNGPVTDPHVFLVGYEIDDFHTIDTTMIIATLTAAVKTLIQEVAQLRADVTPLLE
jgi:hypothetical protein